MPHRLCVAAALALIYLCAPAVPLARQSTPQAPPDQRAREAADTITDPAARLAALNKIRTDFPKSTLLVDVDRDIFNLLVRRLPDRTAEMGATIDRMRARVKPSAPIQERFQASLSPATTLIGARIMLDRAEALIAEAAATFDFDAFAKEQRDQAIKAKRPAPTDEVIRADFNAQGRIPVLEAQGRLALARGNMVDAERIFKEALVLRAPAANPGTLANAMGELADAYDAHGDIAHAETFLREAHESNRNFQRLVLVIAKYYSKHDELAKAAKVLNDRLNMKPPPAFAPGELLLADIEARSGDIAGGLARYLKLSASGQLQGADHEAMVALYRKVHGSDAGLESAIDKVYREVFPNPVKPQAWTPPATRTSRVVLLQLFTGSGCPPCVAADLAVDAMMERYPADAVVPLLYHVHWPRPDPMATSVGETLANIHAVDGVPTIAIDGATVNDEKGISIGGGPRAEAPDNYREFVAHADRALTTPARAELSVAAEARGDEVVVSVAVTKLPASSKGLRVQIVLAERELKFAGENGVRFHPMVVRGMTDAKANGLPVAKTGTLSYTFKLAAIRDDITKGLAADIAQRRARSSSPTTYAAEGHAMTTIDTTQLVVVAYVQDARRQVLQTARTDVK